MLIQTKTTSCDPDNVQASSPPPSYREVLKSSALVGGSSVLAIVFAIIRTKLVAVLLGPPGIGLMAVLNSILDVARSVAGFGMNNSGVREIARSVASKDSEQLARTVKTLRAAAIILGLVGASIIFRFSNSIARLTFGDAMNSHSVAWLSVAVFLGTVSGAQLALVQGMRRITDLAKSTVVGSLVGTVLSVVVIYVFRQSGIAPYVVITAGAGIIGSWWYARKIVVKQANFLAAEYWSEALALLKLGVVFMASGLMSFGTSYLVRIFILQAFGINAAGFYQAAWVLAGLYVGFILQAMGADFLPRLTAVVHDNAAINRLVNEQTEVGLLIAVPGLLATLTFSPLIIRSFYSSAFDPAIVLLQWNCLGMLLRIASWPLAFIIVAKGERGLFMITESLASLFHLGFVWFGTTTFGLTGAGIAFFTMYLFYSLLVLFAARRLSRFRWSKGTRELSLVYIPMIALAFVAGKLLPAYISVALGVMLTVIAGFHSIKTVTVLVGSDGFPVPLRRAIRALGLNDM